MAPIKSPYVAHCLINETDFINFSSQAKGGTQTRKVIVVFFYVLLTAHLSISLDSDQLDTHLLYFAIRLL